MGTIKTQCSCGMLWLSETLGGYDTICDHDGKICGAVNYQDEQFQIIQPEECKKHKRDTMKELKGALQNGNRVGDFLPYFPLRDNRLLVLFWFNPNRTQIFIQSSRGDIEN